MTVCTCFHCGCGKGSQLASAGRRSFSSHHQPHTVSAHTLELRPVPSYISSHFCLRPPRPPPPSNMASSSSSSPELSTAAPAAHEYAHVHYSNLSRDEVLEDLSRCVSPSLSSLPAVLTIDSRFILNLPEEELASVERVCFQVEQA